MTFQLVRFFLWKKNFWFHTKSLAAAENTHLTKKPRFIFALNCGKTEFHIYRKFWPILWLTQKPLRDVHTVVLWSLPPHWFNLIDLAGQTQTQGNSVRAASQTIKRANHQITMLVESIVMIHQLKMIFQSC